MSVLGTLATIAERPAAPFDANKPWVVAFEAPAMDAPKPVIRFADRDHAERCWAWVVRFAEDAHAFGAVIELWHHAEETALPSVEMREMVE